jgi:hypothetical protein
MRTKVAGHIKQLQLKSGDTNDKVHIQLDRSGEFAVWCGYDQNLVLEFPREEVAKMKLGDRVFITVEVEAQT